jgi:hypothetical protein
MFGVDAPDGANFLTPGAHQAALDRISGSSGAGIVEEDRLMRNLLSSQPTCFNLFGPFAERPSLLTPWVQTIDPACVEVEALEFEWAPPPAQHFRGGSAFDAAIFYSDGHQRRLIGVECKYSEDLRKNDPRTVRDVYRDLTEQSGYWHEEAGRRLDRPGLRQLWINTLLAQSVCDRGGYERCTHVVVACGADTSALASVARIRTELHDPDAWLKWRPYETVLGHLGSHNRSWAAAFEQRYLDFGPVAHLLSSDDPRLVAPVDSIAGLRDLAAMGSRVTGAGSVLEQVLEALDRGRMDLSGPELRALNTRAAELAVDLKTFRQALADSHGRIDP